MSTSCTTCATEKPKITQNLGLIELGLDLRMKGLVSGLLIFRMLLQLSRVQCFGPPNV